MSRKTKRSLIAAVVALVAVIVPLTLRTPSANTSNVNAAATSNGTDEQITTIRDAPHLVPEYVSSTRVEKESSLDLSNERPAVAETRSMYQAHASLRTPEVSDPDSDTNRRLRSTLLNNIIALAEQHEKATAETREADGEKSSVEAQQ